MTDETRQKGLGRGLSALLGDDAEDYAALDRVRTAKDVPIEHIYPNPDQPRKRFDEADLAELAGSIREKGILQPILVRRMGDDQNHFQIVAGERRWRAAQKASLHNVPVIVKDLSDAETLEIALIENVQRADLNAIDEAAGYQALMDTFSYTQEQLAKIIGKSRSHIANLLRLLNLPGDVKELVAGGELSAGHARTLLGADHAGELARQIIDKGLSVREAESLARSEGAVKTRGPRAPREHVEKDADTIALEQNLTNSLGLDVTINFRGDQGGDVKITYKTLEQLDEICQRLSAHRSIF